MRHRDFRWLFVGTTVSFIGSWAYTVALAVFVFDQTGSAVWVGAVTVGRFVPALLFSTYAGVIAERFERRLLMIVIDLTCAGIMAALCLVAAVDGPVLAAIVLAAMTSLVSTTYGPSVAAMTPQLVGEDDLASANALNSVVENLAVIVGPGIGAVLLAVSTPTLTFFFNGLTFVFSAWAVSRITVRTRPVDVTEGGQAGFLRQASVGFRAIGSSSVAAVLVGFSVAASFLYGTDTVLFVVLGEDRLGTGPDGFGLLLAALGVGGLLAAPFINRLASLPRLGIIISIGMIAYAGPDLLLTQVSAPGAAFAIVVVRGFATMVVDVLAATALQRSLPGDVIARVFGVYFGLVLGAISLGALLTPILLSAFGLDTTLVIYGVGIPALVVLVYPKIRVIDRITSHRLVELEPVITRFESLGIFAAAPRSVIERLAASAQRITPATGERLIQQGDEPDAFYVLEAGTATVSIVPVHEPGAPGAFVRTMQPGDGFGEIGLIERRPRTASVDAGDDCVVYRIDGEDLLMALSEHAPSPSFLDGASSRLRSTAYLTEPRTESAP